MPPRNPIVRDHGRHPGFIGKTPTNGAIAFAATIFCAERALLTMWFSDPLPHLTLAATATLALLVLCYAAGTLHLGLRRRGTRDAADEDLPPGFRAHVADMAATAGVGPPAIVLRNDPDSPLAAAESHLGRYASFEQHAFVALNTAFIEEGAFLEVARGAVVAQPIYLVFLSAGDAPAKATGLVPEEVSMVPLSTLWVPILVSAVLVFVASSFIHMVLPYHRNEHRGLPKEDEIQQALRKFAIPPDDYFLPHAASMADMKSAAFAEKMKAGPVAIITKRINSTLRNLNVRGGRPHSHDVRFKTAAILFQAVIGPRPTAGFPGADASCAVRPVDPRHPATTCRRTAPGCSRPCSIA